MHFDKIQGLVASYGFATKRRLMTKEILTNSDLFYFSKSLQPTVTQRQILECNFRKFCQIMLYLKLEVIPQARLVGFVLG